MMMFTQEVRNGFEMIGRMAACELPAEHAGRRRFVGVHPPRLEKDIPRVENPGNLRLRLWHVRRFEIPERLVDQYFGEEELLDSESVDLDSLEAVEALLANWGIERGVFQAPWRTDYPL
jgi:hypothetical protein